MENTDSSSNPEFSPSDKTPLFVTAAAVVAAREAIEAQGRAGDGIRVSIVGGGCAGYQYNLDFEQEMRAGDMRMEFDGLPVFIDPISADYLRGTVIDFISTPQGSGFKFNNPNARRTCGCGNSCS